MKASETQHPDRYTIAYFAACYELGKYRGVGHCLDEQGKLVFCDVNKKESEQ